MGKELVVLVMCLLTSLFLTMGIVMLHFLYIGVNSPVGYVIIITALFGMVIYFLRTIFKNID